MMDEEMIHQTGLLQDLTFSGVEAGVVAAGLRPAHAKTVWKALHRDLVGAWSEVPDFSPATRGWLAGQELIFPEQAVEVVSSDGWTRKFLLRLADGREIETVLMGFTGRHTVCLSSQVGCAMGCVFCATGQGGFTRHLRPGEIVAQVRHARRALRTQGFGGAATHAEAVIAFKDVIRAAGFPCTVRQRRGIDVAAGCGQLQATTSRLAAALL